MMSIFAPESFDLSALPRLPLADKRELPNTSAVYFALSSRGRVLYIGRSVDLCERLRRHHRVPLLEALGGVKIAWIEQSNSFALLRLETTLIQYFNPPLNKIPSYLKKEDSEKLLKALNLTDTDKFIKSQPNRTDEPVSQIQRGSSLYPSEQEGRASEFKQVILEQAQNIKHLEETVAELKLKFQQQMQSQHQLTEALVEQAKVITELLRAQTETNSQISQVTVEQALTISKLSSILKATHHEDTAD